MHGWYLTGSSVSLWSCYAYANWNRTKRQRPTTMMQTCATMKNPNVITVPLVVNSKMAMSTTICICSTAQAAHTLRAYILYIYLTRVCTLHNGKRIASKVLFLLTAFMMLYHSMCCVWSVILWCQHWTTSTRTVLTLLCIHTGPLFGILMVLLCHQDQIK